MEWTRWAGPSGKLIAPTHWRVSGLIPGRISEPSGKPTLIKSRSYDNHTTQFFCVSDATPVFQIRTNSN